MFPINRFGACLLSLALGSGLLAASASRTSRQGWVPLAQLVERADVIVGGVYLGTSRPAYPNGPGGTVIRTGHFLVQRVIKGNVQPGVVDIELSDGSWMMIPGAQEIAFLNQRHGSLWPAVLHEPAFYPALARGYTPSRAPLDEVVRELGALVTDGAAPVKYRSFDLLNALCAEPSAARVLIEASATSEAEIRYDAIGCRIVQGDIGVLERLASKLSNAPSPPGAVALAPWIERIRNPGFVPALALMAHARVPELRLAAIRALGYTLACSAIAPLRSILLDGGPADRVAAANALTYIVPGPPRPITAAEFQESGAAITRRLLSSSNPFCKH